MLPDALRCVQEVKQIQQSVQERLDILEGRQQSEEAYLSSLQELQEAIMSQGESRPVEGKQGVGIRVSLGDAV